MSKNHPHSNRVPRTAKTIAAAFAAVTGVNAMASTQGGAVVQDSRQLQQLQIGDAYVWMLEIAIKEDIDGDGHIGPPPPPPGGGGGTGG